MCDPCGRCTIGLGFTSFLNIKVSGVKIFVQMYNSRLTLWDKAWKNTQQLRPVLCRNVWHGIPPYLLLDHATIKFWVLFFASWFIQSLGPGNKPVSVRMFLENVIHCFFNQIYLNIIRSFLQQFHGLIARRFVIAKDICLFVGSFGCPTLDFCFTWTKSIAEPSKH